MRAKWRPRFKGGLCRVALWKVRSFLSFMLLDREGREQLAASRGAMTIGLELGLSVLFGILAGQWIDTKLGTDPWFEWFGLAIGLAAGALSFYRLARKIQKDL